MNVFELYAKLGLDSSEYDSKLKTAGDAMGGFGNMVSGVMSKAAAVGAAAVGTATAAVVGLAKEALDSYANYEQLVGGVEKLYGDASGTIQKMADEAYKTSGMSANQYMETATSFSAALIGSLNGDVNKAAEMTDVAMRAMSDNVNVFGSDMESVQNAFMGFSKQNYTMLDNLKLGYGGTQKEMQRLIDDANEYAKSIGQASDLSIDSFADIVQAIELIQEKQNIAGTTAKEAMTTIEGSATAVKAAWENVKTAIGRGEGIGEAIDGLISSIFGEKEGEGLLNQIIPRLETIMDGIGQFVEAASPYIEKYIPPLFSKLFEIFVPAVTDFITQMTPVILSLLNTLLDGILQAITEKFPELSIVFDNFKEIVTGAVGILGGVQIISTISGFVNAFSTIIGLFSEGSVLMTAISGFGTFFTATIIPALSGVGTFITATIVPALGGLVAAIAPVLAAAAPFIAAAAAVVAAGVLIYKNWDTIKEKAGELAEAVGDKWEGIKSAVSDKVQGMKDAVSDKWDEIKVSFEEGGGGISGLAEVYFDQVASIIKGVLQTIGDIIGVDLSGFYDAFEEKWYAIRNFVVDTIYNIQESISTTMGNIHDGIAEKWGAVKEKTGEAWDSLKNTIDENGGGIQGVIGTYFDIYKSIFETGLDFINNLTGGRLGDFRELIFGKLGEIKDKFTEIIGNAWEWGSDLVGNFVDGLKDRFSDLRDAVTGAAEIVRELLHFSEPDKGPLADFSTYAPDMMKLFAKGIKDNTDVVEKQIEDSFDFGKSITGQDLPTYSNTGHGDLKQVISLLQQIIDNGVHSDIELRGDAGDLFTVIRRKNYEFTQATGYSGL